MTTKEVLLKAAEIIEKRGLYKGWFFDKAKGEEGPLCAVGAINYAVCGKPWLLTQLGTSESERVALAAIQEVEKVTNRYSYCLPQWNDRPRRRKGQVAKLFRRVAESL